MKSDSRHISEGIMQNTEVRKLTEKDQVSSLKINSMRKWKWVTMPAPEWFAIMPLWLIQSFILVFYTWLLFDLQRWPSKWFRTIFWCYVNMFTSHYSSLQCHMTLQKSFTYMLIWCSRFADLMLIWFYKLICLYDWMLHDLHLGFNWHKFTCYILLVVMPFSSCLDILCFCFQFYKFWIKIFPFLPFWCLKWNIHAMNYHNLDISSSKFHK